MGVTKYGAAPYPEGERFPREAVYCGPLYRTRRRAERLCHELEEASGGRWRVIYHVIEVDDENDGRTSNPSRYRRAYPAVLRRWGRDTLKEARSRRLTPAETVGLLALEGRVGRAEIDEFVPPDPRRAKAARRGAKTRRRVRRTVEHDGGGLIGPLVQAADDAARAARNLSRNRGEPLSAERAAREAVSLAAELQRQVMADEIGAAELRDAAEALPDAEAVLFRAAAELADNRPLPSLVAPAPRGAPGRLGPAHVIYGAPTEIMIPTSAGLGIERVPARYALIAASDVVSSHDPFTFSKTRGYPEELQERDYARDVSEQTKVTLAASRLEPDFVLSTGGDATTGPPILDGDRPFVLGGNARSMIIRRALEDYEPALRSELSGCHAFGLSPEDAEQIDDPMLVRVLSGDYDPVSISRDLNLGFTQVAGPAARSVSVGRQLPPRLFQLLAVELLDEGRSLSEAIGRQNREIVRLLREADVITNQTATQWLIQRQGRLRPKLSSEGRGQLRSALLGRLIGDVEALTLTPARLEGLYERSAPALLALEVVAAESETHGAEHYNLTPSFRVAARAVALLPSRDSKAWRAQWSTTGLPFESEAEASPATLVPELLADPLAVVLSSWLVEVQTTPAKGARALQEYSRLATRALERHGQTALDLGASPPSPQDLRVETLGQAAAVGGENPRQVRAIGVERWLAGARQV